MICISCKGTGEVDRQSKLGKMYRAKCLRCVGTGQFPRTTMMRILTQIEGGLIDLVTACSCASADQNIHSLLSGALAGVQEATQEIARNYQS